MSEKYRNLTEEEILILNGNNCSCENWNLVKVKKGFNPKFVKNTLFSGNIRIGVFNEYFELEGGMRKHSGIFRAIIHNCTIGDNVLIENIKGYIANYVIGDCTYIEDCNTLVIDGESSFGNGVRVSVLDETGGREVIIHDNLSSHLAYIYALYKYKPALISKMEIMALDYAASVSSKIGYIGRNVCIKNVGYVKNVKFGDNCHVEDTARLENGSINSNFEASVYIGSEVTATDFIISSDSYIDEGVSLTRCFVGQACKLGHGFSATDSLFFCNSHAENGEACSIFAGPYTVTHHKSTLLIGAMFSFYNAGSGTNQSNHMYKLGPIHQGIMDRGSKTASNSYMMWPSHIGAFSLVIGKHTAHVDTSLLPFSYLVEKEGESYLIPAINLCTVGTERDSKKWPERDSRNDTNRLDYINFALLSPYTVGTMITALDVLYDLQIEQGKNAKVYKYKGCQITNTAIQKAVNLYNAAIDKYIGDILIKQLGSNTDTNRKEEEGTGQWIDIAGLIAPKNEIDKVIQHIENGDLTDLPSINEAFLFLYENYEYFEWNWALDVIKKHYPVKEKELKNILKKWKDASISLDKKISEDAKKEYSSDLIIGFGINGSDEDKKLDVEIVRGCFEENPLVNELLQRIERYEQTYNDLTKLIL